MYQKLKQIIKTFLPETFVYHNELFFRSLYYQFYRGKNYQCNICKKSLKKFVKINSGNQICPSCGSAARNRRLWAILEKDFLNNNIKILHFSPSRSLYRKFKNKPAIDYSSTDFTGEFFADKQLDITNIRENNDTFDLLICYHVLEHIEEDQKALAELYRILKPGGSCLIQTPFKEGNTYEDFSIKSPLERLRHFGQRDHVRIYSVNGLEKRLVNAGFTVEVKEFKEQSDNYFGFKQNEYVIVAKK